MNKYFKLFSIGLFFTYLHIHPSEFSNLSKGDLHDIFNPKIQVLQDTHLFNRIFENIHNDMKYMKKILSDINDACKRGTNKDYYNIIYPNYDIVFGRTKCSLTPFSERCKYYLNFLASPKKLKSQGSLESQIIDFVIKEIKSFQVSLNEYIRLYETA